MLQPPFEPFLRPPMCVSTDRRQRQAWRRWRQEETSLIVFEGGSLGAETFVSFDRKAVALLTAQGRSAQLL